MTDTALIDRVLPGCLRVSGVVEISPFANLCAPQPGGGYVGGYVEALGRTEPLALIIALLCALIDRNQP